MVAERERRMERRQGLILFLLLLGPTPIAAALFLLGSTAQAVASAIVAIVLLIGSMLGLYLRQRTEAARAGLVVLPAPHVAAMWGLVLFIAAAVFLLPDARTARWGALSLGAAIVIVYGLGRALRSQIKEPDERSVVLVLGLMAVLIALAGAVS